MLVPNEERDYITNCDISRRSIQRRNNPSEKIMLCVSTVPSHSGFTPGVSVEHFLKAKVSGKTNCGNNWMQITWGYWQRRKSCYSEE